MKFNSAYDEHAKISEFNSDFDAIHGDVAKFKAFLHKLKKHFVSRFDYAIKSEMVTVPWHPLLTKAAAVCFTLPDFDAMVSVSVDCAIFFNFLSQTTHRPFKLSDVK